MDINKIIEALKGTKMRDLGIIWAREVIELDDLEKLCTCLDSLDRDQELESLLNECQGKLLILRKEISN